MKQLLAILSMVVLSIALLLGVSHVMSKEESLEMPEEKQAEKIEVEIVVSQFMGESILVRKKVVAYEGQTVMEVMQENFEIETEYNGAFISSINGMRAEEGEEASWFYSVNNVEATVGANKYKLSDGDVIQFDFHNWY